MDVTLLLATVAVYRLRSEAHHQLTRFSGWIDEAIEKLPDDRIKAECTGTILCERQGVRHKADCLGRTVPFDAYVKGLDGIQ